MNVTQHRWDDDQHILDDLADAVGGTAPLSAALAAFGRGAWAWRTVDQDLLLAALSFDSSLEDVSDRRADTSDARVLVFTAAPLSVELEVMADRIIGQIVPADAGHIRVEAADGACVQAEADEAGFFELPAPPHGPVRLQCDTPTGRLVTDWVRL